MGGNQCTEKYVDTSAENLFNWVSGYSALPDVGLSQNMQVYLGVGSHAALVNHHENIKAALEGNAGKYVSTAITTLGGLTAIPQAAGLVALFLSIILDAVTSAGKQSVNVQQQLREVFAEEKVSRLSNLAESFYRQFLMFVGNPDHLRWQVQSYESQIFDQLVTVKNSMVYDGHVNSRAVKTWANGAALHSGMLIHLARFDDAYRSAALTTLQSYQRDLDAILHAYSRKKRETIVLDCDLVLGAMEGAGSYCLYRFRDKESGKTAPMAPVGGQCQGEVLNRHINIMMERHNDIKRMKEFFINTERNVDALIREGEIFYLQ
ncbi:uncharacterized protein [Lepisosteus oculatus]|uniref:uncharacterized protein n=1 Tax=Lepisosteus oculatus TaxID=7918 RepID=UPI0035F52861